MSIKKLFVLAIVLLVLGLLAMQSRKVKPVHRSADGPAPGDLVFADLDVNAVAAVEIQTADGTNRLARGEEEWTVDSLHGYPANFDTLRKQLAALSLMKIGQAVRTGESLLPEFGLGDDATTVRLLDKNDAPLSEFRIGTNRTSASSGQFGGYPDGQYLLAPNGSVVLVADSMTVWQGKAEGWANLRILELNGNDVVKASVTSSGQTVAVTFADAGAGNIEGLADNESVNAGNSGRLRRALNYLNAQTIADPALDGAATGLDDPVVYVAEAKDGITYTANIGAKADGGRYARFAFAFTEPPGPTREEAEAAVPPDPAPPAGDEPPAEGEETAPPQGPGRAEKVDARFKELTDAHAKTVEETRERLAALEKLSAWVYLLPDYNAGSMILTRSELVEVKEDETSVVDSAKEAVADAVDTAQDVADTVVEQTKEAVSEAKVFAADAAEQAAEMAEQAEAAMEEAVESARGAAGEMAAEVKEAAGEAVEAAKETVERVKDAAAEAAAATAVAVDEATAPPPAPDAEPEPPEPPMPPMPEVPETPASTNAVLMIPSQ